MKFDTITVRITIREYSAEGPVSQAFIIMQIGNSELDEMFNNVINPAVRAIGLIPKRIDKHNEGRLLKSEITAFIEDSDIIIADLTNERPNCYLEVGYAMGRNQYQNLILMAREDHNSDSPNYRSADKKVHFDLSGYDILFWDPNRLNDFDAELRKSNFKPSTIMHSLKVAFAQKKPRKPPARNNLR